MADPIKIKGINDAVDSAMVSDIIKSAKKFGVNPYTALSVASQETRLTNDWRENPFQVDFGQHQEVAKLGDDNPIDAGMIVLKNKLKQGEKLGKKTEAEIIQSYNGYGKIGQKGESMINSAGEKIYPTPSKKLYGVDVPKEGIDFSKTPLYGKRIIDLRDNVIKKHLEIQKMVKDIYGGEPIHATNEHIQEAMQKTGHTDPEAFTQWFNKTKSKVIVPID